MTWKIVQETYDRNKESYFETLFALSNGYVGVRNTLDFESETAIPGAFFANIYDNSLATLNEIVNIPNWLDFEFFINGERVSLDDVHILNFKRELNMKIGCVTTCVRFQDKKSRITYIKRTDIVHAVRYHNSIIFGSIITENYEADVTIRTFFNYQSGNMYMGGAFNPHVKIHHLKHKKTNYFPDTNTLYLEVETQNSKQRCSFAHKIICNKAHLHNLIKLKNRVGEQFKINTRKGEIYNFTKFVSFFNSTDDIQCLEEETLNELECITSLDFKDLLNEHYAKWMDRWKHADIEITGDFAAQEGIRFSIFHLLQSVHPCNNGTNIPSRGLTSEYHQGHFFFNTEIYCVPYFMYFFPEVSKSLLTFRYNTLLNAIKFAISSNNKGARFPEQADPDGKPGGPKIIFDLINDKVLEEWTGRESKFIGALCVYAIYKYYLFTKDIDFLISKGVPILVETSRYYNDILLYDKKSGKYMINEVTGPDEYHIHVNNSFFTNYMAKKTLEISTTIIDSFNDKTLMKDVLNKLSLSKEEIDNWKLKGKNVYFPPQKNKVFEQFDGYFKLNDKKIEEYDNNHRPIIKGEIKNVAENLLNNTNNIIKQSDVIMLLSLFRSDFSKEEKIANLSYYEPRTVHESSLSTSHTALVSLDVEEEQLAYNYFLNSVRFNLDFHPKENYKNGIHLAGTAGGIIVLLEGFLGFQVDDDIFCINPMIPKNWEKIQLKINWRSNIYKLSINKEILTITPEVINNKEFIKFKVNNQVLTIYKQGVSIYKNMEVVKI